MAALSASTTVKSFRVKFFIYTVFFEAYNVPVIAIPIEKPICLNVAIKADAVPNRFLGTLPIIMLLLGGPKTPNAMPSKAEIRIIIIKDVLRSNKRNRQKEIVIKIAPNVVSHAGLARSDSPPLMGLDTIESIAGIDNIKPAWAGIIPIPWIR